MRHAKVKQAARSQTTQDRIISIAREEFAAKGYAAVSLAEIVAAANVTTGAVYHHFGDKKGLFVAVAEHLEQTIVDEVAATRSQAGEGWEDFVSAVLSTLQICARPDIQRIVFQEAPTVVGPAEWRKIEMNYAFGMMSTALRQLKEDGLVQTEDADLTAQITLGAIIQAAHGIATARNRKAALKNAQETLRLMLSALRAEQ